MKRTNVIPAALALAAVLALATASADAAPRKKAPAHPKPIPVKPVVENPIADLPFPRFDHGPQVASACTTGLEGAMLRVKELEKRKAGADWLKGWEALYDWEEDQQRCAHLPAERAPQRRRARRGREVRPALERLPGDAGASNEPRLPGREADRRRAEGSRSTSAPRSSRSKAFEDSGVALPKDKQAQAPRPSPTSSSTLSQQFNRNIRDARTCAWGSPRPS